MAHRLGESFDHYAVEDILKKWTQSVSSAAATIAISAGNGGHGSSSLRLTTSSGGASYAVHRTVAPSGATCIVGFLFKINSLFVQTGTSEASSCIFATRLTGTSQVWFRLNTDGTVSAMRGTTVLGTSTFAISPGAAAYLEFKVTVSNTVGVVQYRVEGVLDATLNLSSQDTNNGGATDAWNEIKLGSLTNTSGGFTIDYDDLYCADGSGSYNNDFYGPARVDSILTNAVGNSNQSTPSGGGDRYLMVDEAAADGDTTYNTFTAVNDKDTYGMAAHPVSGATVFAVQLNTWTKKADAGVALAKGVLRMGGTDYDHATAQAPPVDYQDLMFVWDRSPVDGTSAFTTGDIDAIETGFKKTA
jgi:hypothetical protein